MDTLQLTVRKIETTAAEQFWYVLGCIAFGAAYLQIVPVKKALSDYGLAEMTAAEQFWYVLGCIAFGMAYFMKVPVAKALSELGQYWTARAPHDQLEVNGPSALEYAHDLPAELPERSSVS